LAIYALTVTLSGVDAAFNIDLQIGTLQSAGANGSLVCKGKPYKGAIVRLYDVDTRMSNLLVDSLINIIVFVQSTPTI